MHSQVIRPLVPLLKTLKNSGRHRYRGMVFLVPNGKMGLEKWAWGFAAGLISSNFSIHQNQLEG